MIDQTLIDGGFWEKATFTVPVNTPDERVQFHAKEYMRKFGEYLEEEGFTVKEMLKPQIGERRFPVVEEDRKCYAIFAFVSRVPVELTTMVPETLIPEMQAKGLKLK